MNDHLADEVLSALIDDQLSPDEESAARTHLGACPDCQTRLQELRSVVVLLRALPSVEPPREFTLGPRLVADPPNVIRLRRWYTVARAGAASLAAAFVFLSVGTLYVDSRPVATTSTLASKAAPAPISAQVSDGVTAPGAPAAENVAAPTAPAQAARQAAPAAAQAPAALSAQAPAPAAAQAPAAAAAQAPAAGAALAAKPSPAAADAADQIAAATSVRPLPTQVPTPSPTQLPFVAAPVPEQQVDTAAPLRTAAATVGVLTVVVLLVAVLVRHRLRAANLQTE